ncbi:tetratricopeptide repeat-containing sensor histidine kinase [Winogradskyella wichelsiae]|uniref:tetratricopeptide repeat-containing sensor histidine kinase n=1 Tax=Winogradskyella wichelsiae TaxID=2697007 RepID=UPI003EF10AC9
MKSINTSFFFFVQLLVLFFCVNNHKLNAQEAIDSVQYYSKLALNPQGPVDLNIAHIFFQRELKKSKSIPNNLNYLYYISSINHKKGDYNASEKEAVKALSLLDKHSDIINHLELKRSFYNLLGMLYYEQRNKEKALELYSKVLAISNSSKDSAIVYNNISNIYKIDNETEKVQEVLLKAYEMQSRIKDTLSIALITDNLGFTYSKLNNTSEGFILMNKALKIREKLKDTTSLYTSYAHLAEYYFDVDSLDKSLKNALKAQELADHINSPIYQHNALRMLTKLSEDKYVTTYKILNDSIYNAEKELASKFALLKYDYSEYKRKALESQLKEERHKTRTIIAIIVAAFIMLLSVSVYFILKSRHRKEKLQQVYDAESRMSKQIHDEVANDVFQFMTKLESENIKNELLLDDLQGIYDKTRDISKAHNYTENEGLFLDSIKDLVLSYSDASTSVLDKGSIDIDWESFSKIRRTTIYKVLQELLINMKKHSQASVAVLIFKNEGKKTIIAYSDNGVGGEFKKNTGLQNVENRIVSINGTITFETEPNKGFKTKIVI